MKKLVLALSFLIALPAIAGKTQVNQDAYKPVGKTGAYYGRSDGIYQEVNSKGLVGIVNGTPSAAIGAAYRETFNYSIDAGMSQTAWSTGLTVAGLTTTVPAMMTFNSGVKLMWAPVVTETLYPQQVSAALGLDISGDLVNLDGLEVWGGQLGASGRPMSPGIDPAFQFCVNLNLVDVSEQTIARIGWRAVSTTAGVPDPMNAVFANYNTYATIGPDVGTINISTELSAAGIVTTDTTDDQADATPTDYCVKVSNAGVVTYTINGAAPTVTAAVTLPSTQQFVPFVHFVHAAAIGAGDLVYLKKWEVSYTE